MLFTFTWRLAVPFTAKLDEYGKGAWIALMVLAFFVYWPAGLAVLAFLIFSGRMRCGKMEGPGRWHNAPPGSRCGWGGRRSSSGNWAFDDYRAETLKRLEEEQREFMEYLERLRR